MPPEALRLADLGPWLVVDDNEYFLDMCAERLRRSGCTVHTTSTYNHAGLLIEQTRVGAIIADHGVGNGSVAEFVVRARELNPDVIIVGCSGRDCSDEFRAIGVDRFLQKPWGFAQLEELLGE